jgi:DNA-binding NtrC family response regulator
MLIYLIDDELIVIKTIHGFLKDLGHEVVSFNSISEFLSIQTSEDGSVDVIIVDLKMPKEDGVKIISEIHKKYPNTNIIVMSSILPFQEAFSYSVFSYLKKPIHFDELELILARVSERHIGIEFDLNKNWRTIGST